MPANPRTVRPEEAWRSFAGNLFSGALVVLALLLIVLWPGDVSWLMDEPRLIAAAWHANHDGHLVAGGLYGNFGVRYGPLPTQLYQLLLLLTHDPLALVVLHALLCGVVTGGALLWLARSLDLPGWFVAGVLVSPHVAAYHRVLWDASFAMPVGALALAAFADFLRTQRPWPLRLCVVCSVLVLTIHPQSLPLAAALLGWLAWQHRSALWCDRPALSLAGILVLVFNGYYFVQLAGQLFARLGGSMQKGYPGGDSHLASSLAPLLGGRLLSGADYLQYLARLSMPAWLHTAAQGCAMLIFPLAWLGICVALREVWRTIRALKTGAAAPAAFTPRQAVLLVLLLGLCLQALLFGAMRIPAAPQYFFGTFSLHALAALLGVGALRKARLGILLGGLYVIGAAMLTVEAAISIHHHGFEQPLWPKLASSVDAAQKLNAFSDATALTDIEVYKKSPQALRTLRLLLPPEDAAMPRQSGFLLITRDPSNVSKIAINRLPPGAPRPAGSAQIDITALPKDWVPDPGTW